MTAIERTEYCGGTDTCANPLSKKNLIVLFRDAGHHQAKHLEKSADNQKPSRSIVIIELSNDGAKEEHEEDH